MGVEQKFKSAKSRDQYKKDLEKLANDINAVVDKNNKLIEILNVMPLTFNGDANSIQRKYYTELENETGLLYSACDDMNKFANLFHIQMELYEKILDSDEEVNMTQVNETAKRQIAIGQRTDHSGSSPVNPNSMAAYSKPIGGNGAASTPNAMEGDPRYQGVDRSGNLTDRGYSSSTEGMPTTSAASGTPVGGNVTRPAISGQNLTDQGYPSSTEGMPTTSAASGTPIGGNGAVSGQNLTAQGYPSSTEGMPSSSGASGTPVGGASTNSGQNLTAQGYPSSTEGMPSTSAPSGTPVGANGAIYGPALDGFNTTDTIDPISGVNLRDKGYPSSTEGMPEIHTGGARTPESIVGGNASFGSGPVVASGTPIPPDPHGMETDHVDITRIYSNMDDAASGQNAIDSNLIYADAFNDTDNLTYQVNNDNGTTLIYRNGVPIGYTDQIIRRD